MTVWAVLAVAFTTACPKELPRDLPPDELYRIGRDYYDRGRYDRAIEALQRVLFQDPGHPQADSAQFLVGESYFHQEQYITAVSEFLRLAQNRPAGPLADDARFRACESYYELSPRPELDQRYTSEAINHCRSVILLYPQSPYASEARERIGELTNKLAQKSLLTARYYMRRRAFDSAIIYLEHLLSAYPEASTVPDALLSLYESYQRVGYVQEAEQIRERLLREYPESPQAARLGGVAANGGG